MANQVIEWRVGTRVTCWDLVEWVQKIHLREEDFYEGDLLERIKRYGVYKLEEIKLSDIERDQYYWDADLVEEYLLKSEETLPPIIVTEAINGMRDIVDGNHRMETQYKRNRKTIMAFVPLESTYISGSDDEDEEDE